MGCHQSRLNEEKHKPSAQGKTMQLEPHRERNSVEPRFQVIRPCKTYEDDSGDDETDGCIEPGSTAWQCEIHFRTLYPRDLYVLFRHALSYWEICPFAERRVDAWRVASMWRLCP